MYFIQYKPLKEKLKKRELSDREALPYLIASSVLAALVIGFPLVENFNEVDTASGFASVALAIWGILYSYKKNGKEEGKDLIHKYVVLGWIVCIRCMLAFIPFIIVYFIIGEVAGLTDLESGKTSWYEFVAYVGFEALIYQRIGRHISDTKEELS